MSIVGRESEIRDLGLGVLDESDVCINNVWIFNGGHPFGRYMGDYHYCWCSG